MNPEILEQSLERQASRIRELECQQDGYRRRAEKAERAHAELQSDILRVGGFEAAARQIVEDKARLEAENAALIAQLREQTEKATFERERANEWLVQLEDAKAQAVLKESEAE